MYKIILFLISFIFLNNQIVEAKSFKSKNGFKFDVPDKHKVVERDYKKAYEKGKDQTSVDDSMLKDSVDVTDQFIIYVFDKKEKDPDTFHINISTSDQAFDTNDFDKNTWCPEFAVYFDQMVLNKSVNMYSCEMDRSIKTSLPILKFVYDSIKEDTFMYHYMFNMSNKSINVAGICLKENCETTDRNLVSIIRSFTY